MKQVYYLFCLFIIAFHSAGQINFNANTPGAVPAYTSNYLFASNTGYYPPWDIYAMADIEAGNPSKNIAGVGIKSMHQPLPEEFLDTNGYAFYQPVFSYYKNLGMIENVIWLETPTAAHSDPTIFPGCTDPSKLWANMYEPIWDGGANGTPVNENNYLAMYVYKTVSAYKPWIKLWEIINEPDFDWGANGFRPPGDPGNWWDRNPQPNELPVLNAPIFYYIRALRITYEVIKYVDPTAYVSMGGTGYPSFYDAILRNTDNPADGSVTSAYPAGGGAYFDCASFHYYPMYDVYDNRNSDAAVDAYIGRKKDIESVLYKRGYNDTVYPKKIFFCTENNIPRISFNEYPDSSGRWYLGGDDLQRNYDIKAAVSSQLNDIKQLYIFSIGDSQDDADATDPFQVVGFYKNLNADVPYTQRYNHSGIAYKTFSDGLSGFKVDTQATTAMHLPSGVRGAAFKSLVGEYRYVLWAVTTADSSEAASAVYSFPAAMNVPSTLTQHNWDYFQTKASGTVSSQNIALTGAPTLLIASLSALALKPNTTTSSNNSAYFSVMLYPNPARENLMIKLHLKRRENVSIKITDASGKLVSRVADNVSYSAGDNFINVPLPASFGNGLYYCRFIDGAREQTIKFVIAK